MINNEVSPQRAQEILNAGFSLVTEQQRNRATVKFMRGGGGTATEFVQACLRLAISDLPGEHETAEQNDARDTLSAAGIVNSNRALFKISD